MGGAKEQQSNYLSSLVNHGFNRDDCIDITSQSFLDIF